MLLHKQNTWSSLGAGKSGSHSGQIEEGVTQGKCWGQNVGIQESLLNFGRVRYLLSSLEKEIKIIVPSQISGKSDLEKARTSTT